MPAHPKSISITFEGITGAEEFGFPDVNRTFELKYNQNTNSYSDNLRVGDSLAQVAAQLSGTNSVSYSLFKLGTSQADHVFIGSDAGNVIQNTATYGGTATITAT